MRLQLCRAVSKAVDDVSGNAITIKQAGTAGVALVFRAILVYATSNTATITQTGRGQQR